MMKKDRKFLAAFIFFILCAMTIPDLQAQSNFEVGARFGDNIAVEATIPIGAAPRLHPSVYIVDRFGVGAYFDWMFALSGGPTGLKFYPGIGPEFYFENSFDFHIAGNFGVEYAFEFPMVIGFDWRPGFKVTEDFKFKYKNWGFTIRFRIGQAKFVKAN